MEAKALKIRLETAVHKFGEYEYIKSTIIIATIICNFHSFRVSRLLVVFDVCIYNAYLC